ncbi:MAG TPA: glycosyltransferase, partial [Usitatibacter sp.]|nr:glycosyltransferase [Usitatibacter sp.]
DPFAALQRALDGHEIVGVAGSRLVSGPAVLWAGQPHLFGVVAYPAENGIKMAVYSLATGVLPGMQALDGLLVAVQRPAALSIGFDAETFDGFHFYDLDFVYRAHLAGLRIAVSTGILAVHASEGRFDEDWNRYAQRFMRKFPRLAAPKGPSFSFARRLATREQAVRFHEDLNAMGAIA